MTSLPLDSTRQPFGRAEHLGKDVGDVERRGRLRAHAVDVGLRARQRRQDALEVVGALGHLDAGLLEHLLVHHQRGGDDRPRDRHAPDLAAVERARAFPVVRRHIRQVRVVLDRVAGEERRQVRHLGLQERQQVGQRIRTALVDVHHVGQVFAGDQRVQLGRVVGRRHDGQLECSAELLVDLLPGGVLLDRAAAAR